MANANPHMLDELYSFTTCDVLITDLDTGVELYSGTLKSHSINKTSNKTPIKAGIGGITWVELEDSSEITVEIVELRERIDMEALKLSGTAIPAEESDFTMMAFPKNYTLGANAGDKFEITLDHNTIINPQTITVYRTDNNTPIIPARVSIAGNVLSIHTGVNGADGQPADQTTTDGLAQNDVVLVGSYKYTQDKATVIHINPEMMGTNVSVTLKQPLYGADKKIKMWRQYHFYRCSLGTEFTQESATEFAEQNTSSSFTVLKDPKQEKLGYIAYVPAVDNKGTAPFRVTRTKNN